jgi:hypothetical protein
VRAGGFSNLRPDHQHRIAPPSDPSRGERGSPCRHRRRYHGPVGQAETVAGAHSRCHARHHLHSSWIWAE